MSTHKGRANGRRRRNPYTGPPQPTGIADPRTLSGIMAGPGGPRDRNGVVLDTTDVVLLESVDVAVMEAVRHGAMDGRVTFMTLGGRVNKTTRHVTVGFMFGPDGGAAIITELLSLADRDGPEFLTDLTRRLVELYREGNTDLLNLRTAINDAFAADPPTETP